MTKQQDPTNLRTKEAVEAAMEKTFGQMILRAKLRHLGMGAKDDNSWGDDVWSEAKNELHDIPGSAETIAAMEVAESIAHADAMLTALGANVDDARARINAAFDEIQTHTQQALTELADGHLGNAKLWPSLQALCRAVGTLRGSEAILASAIETTFQSFYASAQAIKAVQQAQEHHEQALIEDAENAEEEDDQAV